MTTFEGLRCVVVGGTRGVGRATVAALASRGAQVVLTGRDEQRCRETAKELSGPRVEIGYSVGDFASEEDSDLIAASVRNQLGGLDVAVNAAGVDQGAAPFLQTPRSAMNEMYQANLVGIWNSMHWQLPMLVESGGSLTNVSSVSAIRSVPMVAAYSAAKAGVLALTKTAAIELAGQGVRVNAVCPGGIESDMSRSMRAGNPDWYDMATGMVPMKRFGTVEEITSAVLWLADPSNSYTTGHIVIVDGGVAAS